MNYSLIIPHYNNLSGLKNLLDSIPIRQDLEIIVVDDRTPGICLETIKILLSKFPFYKVLQTSENGGGGVARNVGLEQATGKYVIFADGDDLFNDKFNDILEQYKATNLDIIYCSATFEINDKKTLHNYVHESILKYQESCDITNIKYRFTQPWAKIISNKLIVNNKIKFEESRVSNDVKFSTLVDSKIKNYEVNYTPIYNWIIKKNSTSHGLTNEKILIRLKIDLERAQFLRQIGWKSKNDYLWMLNEVFNKDDSNFEQKAKGICKQHGIKSIEILLYKVKWRLKKLLKRI